VLRTETMIGLAAAKETTELAFAIAPPAVGESAP
jgi:hypothetical protein